MAVIVVDDGSTDRTGLEAREAQARVIRTEASQGAAAARNVGLHAASTEWVAFLDADDAWEPDHLQRLGDGAHEGVNLIVGGARRVDGHGRSAGWVRPPDKVDAATIVTGRALPTTSAVAVRRSAALSVGGFDERFVVPSCEDWDLWVRLALVGDVSVAAGLTAVYTVDDGAKTGERLDRRAADRRGAVARRLAGADWDVTTARQARAFVEFDLARTYVKFGRRGHALSGALRTLRLEPTRARSWLLLALCLLPRTCTESIRRGYRSRRARTL